jgi:hypothetical protein
VPGVGGLLLLLIIGFQIHRSTLWFNYLHFYSYRIVLLLRLLMRCGNKARGCLARGFGGAAVWKLGAGIGRSPAALRVLVLFLYIRTI